MPGGNTRLRLQSALGSRYEARAGLPGGGHLGLRARRRMRGHAPRQRCLGARLYGLSRRQLVTEAAAPAAASPTSQKSRN